jgi:sporadic carbohydrate cluster 2OG-Fe(II) oxygenase
LNDFYTEQEKKLSEQFLKNKYIIAPIEDKNALYTIRSKIAFVAADFLHHTSLTEDKIDSFLNHIHEMISVNELNELRLKIITEINQDPSFREAYFKVGRNILMTLAGNELAMQRRINLSIQLPHDNSSLLPIHADVWAGDSPFEIVLWLPLVNCYATKSMYITEATTDDKIQKDFDQFKNKSSEDLYQSIQDKVKFLNVPFEHLLLFSQNVMHGNRINVENETRWSLNCRFKSILTPYHGKKLGEFFEPITIRPLTSLGLNYQLPTGFYE